MLQCKGSLLRGKANTHLLKPKESSENQAQLSYDWLTTLQILHHLDLEIVLRFTGGTHLYNPFQILGKGHIVHYFSFLVLGLWLVKALRSACAQLHQLSASWGEGCFKGGNATNLFSWVQFSLEGERKVPQPFLERRCEFYCPIGVHASELLKKAFLSFS